MSDINDLLMVQQLDTKIMAIERELRDIPARKNEELTRLDEHKKSLEAANEGVKGKLSQIKQQELDVESCQQKITKFRQQQLDIKTNREFKAMETEVANVESKISGFEDQELVLMEELDALKASVAVRKADLVEEESAVNEDVVMLDGRAKELEAELGEEQGKREFAAKDINPEWLERYNLVMRSKGTGLVKLEDGVCGGCHMKLPPALVHLVRRHDTMTTCDFCGRLLY